MPIFLKAQFGLNTGKIGPKEALKSFHQSLKYLEESLEHLKFECEGSFGYQMKIGAQDSHQQLKSFIEQIEAVIK